MSTIKFILVIILMMLLSACATNLKGVKQCGGTAAVGAVIGGITGFAVGKLTEDDNLTKEEKRKHMLKYTAGGAAIGGIGATIGCLFNQNDRANVQTVLSTPSESIAGWCLHDESIKTRGFQVQPKQCPEDKPPVNLAINKTVQVKGKICKYYSTEVLIKGKLETEKAFACQGEDGLFHDEAMPTAPTALEYDRLRIILGDYS
jgi:surface antigen